VSHEGLVAFFSCREREIERVAMLLCRGDLKWEKGWVCVGNKAKGVGGKFVYTSPTRVSFVW